MLNGESLKNVEDFLCLGSRIDCWSKDIQVKIGRAWSALHKLDTIWKSELSDGLKIGLFRATVETVLLYGSTDWTLTKSWMELIQNAQNGEECDLAVTNEVLYGSQPQLEGGALGSAAIAGGVNMKLWAIWFCGNRSMAKGVSEERLVHVSICRRPTPGSPETACR